MYPRSSGQALLLVIMMIAVGATIIGTAAYRANTETQSTKDAQEGKVAFQRAEGILDQALKGQAIDPYLTENLNTQRTQVIRQAVAKASSVTDEIPKDGQYTLYMAEYDPLTSIFGSTPPTSTDYFSGPVTVYFMSSSDPTQCPVLEITQVLATTPETVKREVSGGCNANGIPNATLPVSTPASRVAIGAHTYGKSITLPVTDPTKYLVIRSLFAPTRLGFDQQSAPALKPQGIQVSASVQTIGGAQKTVRVFQPFPQIPAEFFVTSF